MPLFEKPPVAVLLIANVPTPAKPNHPVVSPYSTSPLPARLLGPATHALALQKPCGAHTSSLVHGPVPQVAFWQRYPLQSCTTSGAQEPMPSQADESTIAELSALHAGVVLPQASPAA
jgi:hypothetical protein